MSWLGRFLGRAEREAGPEAAPRGDPIRIAEVTSVLDGLRPLLALDGGNVELVAVDDGWVSVRLLGACTKCHVSDMTVHGAIEPKLREELDWFAGLRAV